MTTHKSNKLSKEGAISSTNANKHRIKSIKAQAAKIYEAGIANANVDFNDGFSAEPELLAADYLIDEGDFVMDSNMIDPRVDESSDEQSSVESGNSVQNPEDSSDESDVESQVGSKADGNKMQCTVQRPINNENFAIYQRILGWIITERTNFVSSIPTNADTPLYSHKTSAGEECCQCTVREFSQSINSLFESHRVTMAAQTAILQFMSSTFSMAAIPVHVSREDNAVSDLKRYVTTSARLMTISICPDKSCCAFFGDLEDEIYCPVCYAKRFSHCTQVSCADLAYYACPHHKATRTPLKTMHYRPLLGLLIELLETTGFAMCLNGWSDAYAAGLFSDVMHGANIKKHLGAMHTRFLHSSEHLAEVTEINILLSLFYDGGQVYKSTTSTFWPLFCSILNLPPTFRNKMGVGTFLIALYTGILGNGAESFLFEELFMGELQAFERGQFLEVKSKKYFIQIRLVQHCLDTKALGKMLNVQEATSIAGCPLCLDFPGTYRSELNKVVYAQHRRMLPESSALRILGNSTVCCPRDYYQGEWMKEVKRVSKERGDTVQKKAYQRIVQNLEPHHRVLQGEPRNWYTTKGAANVWSCDMDQDTVEKLRKKLKPGGNTPPVWYHTPKSNDIRHPHQFAHIQNSLHYVHCDLRRHAPYSPNTMHTFKARGELAARKRKVEGGYKGTWTYSKLGYADVATDVTYDPFHAMLGCAQLLIKGMKGGRLTANVNKYCTSNNVHPAAKYENAEMSNNNNGSGEGSTGSGRSKKNKAKKVAPWILTEVNQHKLDAYINSVLVPITYSDKFQIKNVFQQTGNMRGHDSIMFFTVLIRRINMICALDLGCLDKGVMCFMDMFGSDLIDLLSPVIPSAQYLEDLHKRIIETVACNEGIFPDSESNFVWHELLHLPLHILQMGPLPGWWTYFGERLMSAIKDCVPEGGQSMEKTVMKNFNSLESARTQAAYNFDVGDCKDHFGKEIVVSRSPEGVFTLVSNNYRFELMCDISKTFVMRYNDWEQNELLCAMVFEVVKQTNSEAEALKRSAVYRLNFLYEWHSKNFQYSLYEWFLCLSQVAVCLDDQRPFSGVSAVQKFAAFILNEDVSTRRVTDAGGVGVLCVEGWITYGDVKCAEDYIARSAYRPRLFKNATVYGQRFSGRGVVGKESSAPSSNYTFGKESAHRRYHTNNSWNDLATHWHEKRQYSSWCKCRPHTRSHETAPLAEGISNYFYAQVNYFFYVEMLNDEILSGVPFVSVVQRAHNTDPRYLVDVVTTAKWTSTIADPTVFTAVTNLYATAVLVQPNSAAATPIRTSRTSKKYTVENSKYSCNNVSQISSLQLLPLYPMNDCIKYDRSKNGLYNES